MVGLTYKDWKLRYEKELESKIETITKYLNEARKTNHYKLKQTREISNAVKTPKHMFDAHPAGKHTATQKLLTPKRPFSSTLKRIAPTTNRMTSMEAYQVSKFRPLLTPTLKKVLLDTLLEFTRVAKQLNFTYMLYGGSLLGSYRHHDLIPWDDDMDVQLEFSTKDTLLNKLSSKEYKVVVAGARLKFFNRNLTVKPDHKFYWRWPLLDICFYKENDTHLWDADKMFKRDVYPKKYVFPLTKRPFANHWFNVPKDPLMVLRISYGNARFCATHFWNHKSGMLAIK